MLFHEFHYKNELQNTAGKSYKVRCGYTPELLAEEGLLDMRVLPVKLVTKATGATRLVSRLVIGLTMVKLDMKKRFPKDGTSLSAAPSNIVFQDLY